MPTLLKDQTQTTAAADRIAIVDPQGQDAMVLLREAAKESRKLYPELHPADAPWPVNAPTPERGAYLVAYRRGKPVACGALRPLDALAAEIQRIFVLRSQRRSGLASAMLDALEREAARLGFAVMRLATGHRQEPAQALYQACGFKRIPPFGEHIKDFDSVCYEKRVHAKPRV